VLLGILSEGSRPEMVRAAAAIALGPALETADTDGFDFPDDVPISERKFKAVRDALRGLYLDAGVPKEVRRRVLEAAVRAPLPWQRDAVRAAWISQDAEWKLTAAFCMGYVQGFEEEIMQALSSVDPRIHYEGVVAAGRFEIDEAWAHVAELVADAGTPKPLLLAAIDSAAAIRPTEAGELLDRFVDSKDEEISDAVEEALSLAEALRGVDDDDDEGDDEEGGDDDDDDDDGGEEGGNDKVFH